MFIPAEMESADLKGDWYYERYTVVIDFLRLVGKMT